MSGLFIVNLIFIRVFFRRNFMRYIASLVFNQVVLMALIVQPFACRSVWSYETLKNWFLAYKFDFLWIVLLVLRVNLLDLLDLINRISLYLAVMVLLSIQDFAQRFVMIGSWHSYIFTSSQIFNRVVTHHFGNWIDWSFCCRIKTYHFIDVFLLTSYLQFLKLIIFY